jgi:hypothetical protein
VDVSELPFKTSVEERDLDRTSSPYESDLWRDL